MVGIDNDPWLALQFDNAVAAVGSAIENASQEMYQAGAGDKKEWKPKYTMKQLLDPDFRLPLSDDERPLKRERETDDKSFFSGLAGFSVEVVS